MSFLPALRKEVKSLARTYSTNDDKAFVIWAATVAFDLDADDAYDALGVEGSNEKGMDLFWIDQANQTVLIGQCKHSPKGTHRPRVKDVDSLFACLDWLAVPEALEREGRSELAEAAKEYQQAVAQDFAVHLWFIYSGGRDENVDKRVRVFNANPENSQKRRSGIHCDLRLLQTLYEEARGEGRRIESAKITVSKKAFEVTGDFGKGLVTSVRGAELARLYESHGDRLFARNVRGWLGARKGSVNAGILNTLSDAEERGNFWAYNNGLTIVCDRYAYDQKKGNLKLTNFSVVNGCQTTVALGQKKKAASKSGVFLLTRVISPPESLIDSIIRFTNSQNQIRKWDLVSQDRTQRRLQHDFASLQLPVYYDLRRGDWSSLEKVEKEKYRTLARGPSRTIKHDLLAQYLASFTGNPVVAYKNKAFLFDKFYEETFPADLRVEEALLIWKAGESTQRLVRDEIRKENEKVRKGEASREKYVLMLKRGGRFYSLAVFGLVANLRNGPDYLRSIAEDRIASKGASDRLEKYGRISVSLYKQAVDDLLGMRSIDLSVLIRESDFFKRVSERVTNAYETLSVSKEWLKDALPKLF